MLSEFTVDEKADIESMLALLENWKGTFAETDVGATVYMYWQVNFYRSLFHKQLPKDLPESLAEYNRMAFSDNYQFIDFFQKHIRSIAENPTNELNIICENAQENYSGDKACAYNVARAFLDTKNFLNKNLGYNSDNWLWRNVHANEYPNTPWSKTPLRPIFHREVPTPGNTNTPNVAKISMKRAAESDRFISTHAANFKFAV
jgi:acyl-homoserine lactone acylase PvdQ